MSSSTPIIPIRFPSATARARHSAVGVLAQYIQDLTHPRVAA
jgi:hypothetical protein